MVVTVFAQLGDLECSSVATDAVAVAASFLENYTADAAVVAMTSDMAAVNKSSPRALETAVPVVLTSTKPLDQNTARLACKALCRDVQQVLVAVDTTYVVSTATSTCCTSRHNALHASRAVFWSNGFVEVSTTGTAVSSALGEDLLTAAISDVIATTAASAV